MGVMQWSRSRDARRLPGPHTESISLVDQRPSARSLSDRLSTYVLMQYRIGIGNMAPCVSVK